MKENKTKPDIRFKGFTEAWEQRKLGDICSEIGDGLHSAPTYDNNGEYYFINGNNLVNGHIEIDELETKRVSSYTFASNDKCLDEKTVLLSINGTIGNLAYYAGEKVMLGKSAAYLKVKDIKKEFLYTSLQTEMILNNFMLSLTGTTIKNLGLEAIKKTSILIPGYDEQTKISKHFNDLDNLITLHQRECDQLKELKKSMLKKMFPRDESSIPEVRFAGFTDAWEQRKLGNIGVAKSGIGFPDAEQGGTEGIPFYKVSDMNTKGNEHELVIAKNYVTQEQIAKKKWNVIEDVPAIFFAKVGAAVMLNRKRLVRFPFLLDNNTMAYIFDKNVWDYNFGKTLFETIDLTKLTQVGALPSYNASDVEGVKISIPNKQEQEQIGGYFSSLDNLITLHQRELEILKNLKKTCLKRMFI